MCVYQLGTHCPPQSHNLKLQHTHFKVGIGTKGGTNATNAFQCWQCSVAVLLLDAKVASYTSLKQI